MSAGNYDRDGDAGRPANHVAVLAADVVGYSRLMEAAEQRTHSRLMDLRFNHMEPIIAIHHGRVVKNNGDGFLAMFPDAVAGLTAAQQMQRAVMSAESRVGEDRRINFRMGVNVTDVIVEDHDIYGDGVNVAARLQSHAEPCSIVVSGQVVEEVGGTLGMHAVDLGQMHMRNRLHPVRVVLLRFEDAPVSGTGEVEAGFEARPSIAVLPFRKLATGDDYFTDGFVDPIIHACSALKELLVIQRGSTLGFGRGDIDIKSIGKELGVRYVLYGSVQRAGDKLRICTEHWDVELGDIVRSGQYDGTLEDLFELQDRIAIETIKMIAPGVREREMKRALRKHPQNMTAYDLVLQALELLNRLDYANFSRARGLLQRAMNLDPGYAPAYYYAAWWHNCRIAQQWSADLAMDGEESVRLATAALERDPTDALALATYGQVMSLIKKRFTEALDSFDRALAASPSSAIAWTLKATTLSFIGDGPGAVRCAMRGLQLSPVDTNIGFMEHILSQAFYVNGEYENAILWGRRSLAHNPQRSSNLRILAASLVAGGRLDEAKDCARRMLAITPEFHLLEWKARTPVEEPILTGIVERLRAAGLPD